MSQSSLFHNRQKLISQWLTSGLIYDEKIVSAFLQVPREHFVSKELQGQAYTDVPLPTLRDQSISQPSTVVLMLQALVVKKGDKILEVGTGVGYQACILSHLVESEGMIVTTEIIPELVILSKKNISEMKCKNVLVLEHDGSVGEITHAPFDKIIVTAACPSIPETLVKQLKEGGILVCPIGTLDTQQMIKATKLKGQLVIDLLGLFTFVPLRGKYGFEEEI